MQRPSLTCTVLLSDMLLDDTGGEGGLRKEGRHVKIVVNLDEYSKWGEVRPDEDIEMFLNLMLSLESLKLVKILI